jgi:hypothetical protein
MKSMVTTKSLLALAGACALVLAVGCSGSDEGEGATTTTTTSGTTGDGNGVAMVTSADVMEVLNAKCASCHTGAEAPEELHLDSLEGLMKGSEHGPVVVAGDAAGSLIVKAMRGTDGVKKMPPQGDPVPEEDIKKIEEWINSGAKA